MSHTTAADPVAPSTPPRSMIARPSSPPAIPVRAGRVFDPEQPELHPTIAAAVERQRIIAFWRPWLQRQATRCRGLYTELPADHHWVMKENCDQFTKFGFPLAVAVMARQRFEWDDRCARARAFLEGSLQTGDSLIKYIPTEVREMIVMEMMLAPSVTGHSWWFDCVHDWQPVLMSTTIPMHQ